MGFLQPDKQNPPLENAGHGVDEENGWRPFCYAAAAVVHRLDGDMHLLLSYGDTEESALGHFMQKIEPGDQVVGKGVIEIPLPPHDPPHHERRSGGGVVSLWWMSPGWGNAQCGNCGGHIMQSGGDPDWGLCWPCMSHQTEQAQYEERDQQERYENEMREMERHYRDHPHG